MIVDATVNTGKRRLRSWFIWGIIVSVLVAALLYFFEPLGEDGTILTIAIVSLAVGFVILPLALWIFRTRLKRWFIRGIICSVIVAALFYLLNLYNFESNLKLIIASVIGGFILATILPILFSFIRRKRQPPASSGGVFGGGWTSSST